MTPRDFGPLARFDPHHASTPPAVDPAGRSVLYVGDSLITNACEVFGETGEAALCPNWRVALLRPLRTFTLLDLTAPGCAMAIGALPTLAIGPEPRSLTQQWARAIYEDDPGGSHLDGIRYRSAYNNGLALALWDSAGDLDVLADSSGAAQDYPLVHPPIYARLLGPMNARHIGVSITDPANCPRCL